MLRPSDRDCLVDELLRRRAIDDAMAVQAVAVLEELEELEAERGDLVIPASIRFAELLDLSGRDAEAVSLRRAIASVLAESDRGGLPIDPDERARLRRFWIAAGDDRARVGDVAIAADCWRRADLVEAVAEPALRARRLRAELALGRDRCLQGLLLDAADEPTADDLAFAATLVDREPPVELDRIIAVLEARAVADDGVGGPLRVLVAIDPARGGVVLERLAARDRGAVAGPLVAAGFAGGVDAAVAVAASIDG